MYGLTGSILQKSIDFLMVLVLVKAFEAAQSPWAVWVKFCALPELSQIGTVTVAVLVGALVISTVRRLVGLARRGAILFWRAVIAVRTWLARSRGR